MTRGNIKLEKPERFMGDHKISPQKLELAIKRATDKLYSKIEVYQTCFPVNIKRPRFAYVLGENKDWITGMLTGCFNLAYELTGNKEFLETAKKHMPTYTERIVNARYWEYYMNCHDVGFAFSPSMVYLYKLTGNEEARQLALDAALHFYNISYTERGKFILRSAVRAVDPDGCRTMMDTLMNIPLLFWAANEIDFPLYKEAAHNHTKITRDFLIREDGSSYHHYQFDTLTHKPVKGVTLQGNRDESTWSRGHAWGVYGFPVAYDYTGDETLMAVHKDVVSYMLNNLPDDNIPYWDYDFSDGSDEPRDTSAAVISACGLLEAIKYMPSNSPEREIYYNVANMMVESVIDKYTSDFADNGQSYDGLLWGVTGARPFNSTIEGCGLYADYFYLEALLRLKKPEWKRPW